MRKVLVLSLTFVVAVMFFASCKKQDIDKDKAAVRALVEGGLPPIAWTRS